MKTGVGRFGVSVEVAGYLFRSVEVQARIVVLDVDCVKAVGAGVEHLQSVSLLDSEVDQQWLVHEVYIVQVLVQ